MRRTRKSLRARARRQAQSWATPTHNLAAKDAENRVFFAWLQGYDAARRDMREDRQPLIGIDGERQHRLEHS